MRLVVSFAALFLSVFLVQLGSGSLGPLDALSGAVMGWSAREIGLLGSAHFAGFFLGCWAMPRLIGGVGHVRAFAAAAALGAIGVLLHPVLTGTIDREIELSIARATAAQFQCYVFDINGIGAGGLGRSCVVDPAGQVLHQAGGQEEMIPIEIDLAQVRRQRETGLRGLGQVLKSFRDRPVDFPVYDRAAGADGYLGTLGPLEMPARGSQAGL